MITPGDEHLANDDYPPRRPRTLLRRVVVVSLVLALFAGVAGPLVITVINVIAQRSWRERALREREALARLDYPTLPPGTPSTLTRQEHLGGINISTGYLPVATTATIPGKPDHAGTFFMEARTRHADNEPVRRTVMVTLAGDAANPVPQAQYQTSPLTLRIGGKDHPVYSTAWEASQLAARFKDDRFASNMVFSIPTALYIQWLKEPTLRASVGPYTLTAPEQTRSTLTELGAAMKR